MRLFSTNRILTDANLVTCALITDSTFRQVLLINSSGLKGAHFQIGNSNLMQSKEVLIICLETD